MKPREKIYDMLFRDIILQMNHDQLLQPRLKNRIDRDVRVTEQGRTLQSLLYKALSNGETGSNDFT